MCFTMDLSGESYLVQSGSFLASSEGVQTDTKWGGAKTFFGGEGLDHAALLRQRHAHFVPATAPSMRWT